PIHWLRSDRRNKLWHDMGAWITGSNMLFPGLLAPLCALSALRLRQKRPSIANLKRYSIVALDALIVLATVVAVISVGYQDTVLKVLDLRIIRLNQRSVT